MGKSRLSVNRIFRALALLFALVGLTPAEQLPIKTYTTADGLVSNRISRIKRDTRGFLWFCTEDGLSRFDGYSFTNYTMRQGLPSNWIDDFLETRNGAFLVATSAGLCIFNPQGVALSQAQLASRPDAQPLFSVFRPEDGEKSARIKVLYEDRQGNLFCGTVHGLYQLDLSNRRITFHKIDLGMPADSPYVHRIRVLTEDQQGNLWIASDNGLYRRAPDGKTTRFSTQNGLPAGYLMGLLTDRRNKLWLGMREVSEGVYQIDAEITAKSSIAMRHFAEKEGLPCAYLNTLFESVDGRIWVGMDCGLAEFLPAENRFRRFLSAEQLVDARVWSLHEDSEGNLWVGTAGGAVRITHGGFTSYTESDGLGFRDVYHITQAKDGTIKVFTRTDDLKLHIDRFDGERFRSQKILPRATKLRHFDWYQGHFPFQDSRGEWWCPTFTGLYRFAGSDEVETVLRTQPIAHYTAKDGLPGNYLRSIYEDRRGDLWISMLAPIKEQIVRWERATGRFHIYSDADGLPVNSVVTAVCEDAAGNLWVGFVNGSLARYNAGRFTTYTAADDIPTGEIKQLLCDSRGRLWIAASDGGLGKIDNPAAEPLEIVIYTTANALASDSILCIAEDRLNRFYVGTARGLNYVDFDTGSVKRFTRADGLANNQVDRIFRDRSGAFWFGTATGISRLLPQAELRQFPPSVFINNMKIAGETQQISEIGETALRGIELAPNRNHIEISFTTPAFAAGDVIQYQYQLQGADPDWQPLTAQRTVNYANLKAGDYRFLVRAVSANGAVSREPATLEFRVLAPVWQRWWFITIVALTLALASYTVYRYRIKRLLELERVRTRIAADLHDDIGANLTRISILSEVAHSQLTHQLPSVETPMSSVAAISRECIAAMSDIVWAINPKKDSLRNLLSRMRRFAEEVLTTRQIDFVFRAPDIEQDSKLGADLRGDIYLIFKEIITNAVRHADCQRLEIDFQIERSCFILQVSDDGKGFDTGQTSEGLGLTNMQRRAQALGGTIEISSSPQDGTEITLTVPRR